MRASFFSSAAISISSCSLYSSRSSATSLPGWAIRVLDIPGPSHPQLHPHLFIFIPRMFLPCQRITMTTTYRYRYIGHRLEIVSDQSLLVRGLEVDFAAQCETESIIFRSRCSVSLHLTGRVACICDLKPSAGNLIRYSGQEKQRPIAGRPITIHGRNKSGCDRR